MARVRDYKAEYQRRRQLRRLRGMEAVRDWEQKFWSEYMASIFSPQMTQFMRQHDCLPN